MANNSWLVWAVLSAVFAGATAVLAKAGVEGLNPNLATAIRTTVVLVFTWLLVFGTNALAGVGSIGRKAWIFLVLSGVATGLSWLCYFRALQLGPASKVAPVDKLSVVFAIVFAVIFLKETAGWQVWLGGGLMMAGAIVMAWRW